MLTAPKVLAIFFLWIIVSGVFISRIELYSFTYVRCFAVMLLYYAAKLFNTKSFILYAILSIGLLQALVAFGQQLSYIKSNHFLFDITGLLSNPGEFGGYQAITLVITATLAKECTDKRYKLILFLVLLIIGYSVIISDSRASWLASLFGMAALFYQPIINIVGRYKTRIILPMIVIAVILVIAIFKYRSGSANSRILIWRVSANMICDAPLWGHGLASFNKYYMLYQAEFFKENSNSPFTKVADNVAYPYNEFLHIWIELGAVGLFLFIVASAMILYQAENKIRSPIIALLFFSMFSYPASTNALLMFFPLLAGIALSQKQCKYGNSIGACLIVFVSWLCITEQQYIKELNHNLQKALLVTDKQSELYIENNTYHIVEYPQLNTLYSLVLAKQSSIVDYRKINLIFPTCENWCDIGNIYEKMDSFDIAEKYYKIASFMVPTRFTPKYLLFKMYRTENRTNEAVKIAEEILRMPLKVENTYTLRHKAEINAFLEYMNKPLLNNRIQ